MLYNRPLGGCNNCPNGEFKMMEAPVRVFLEQSRRDAKLRTLAEAVVLPLKTWAKHKLN